MAAKAKETEAILFVWEGIDKNGKRVKGEQSGRSETLVKAQLRQQGIKPIKVKKKPKSLFSARAKKITPKDIAVFSRQLATMLTAGVPLVQAFDIVGRGHENPSMQKLILKIKEDVESGSTLTEALRKHPLYFDELFCNLVHAGEQAGVLETLLDKIATYKEKIESLKGKVKKALFYPAAVVVVACIVTAILLIFVVPQFEELFKGFGADLPAFTQLVIELSRFMQESWYYLLGSIAILSYVFVYFKKRSRAFNHFLDRVFLKIPIIGPQILHKSAVARFARTLSTMSAAGVP
ncbi:MAG: type II secretion system F family protein, partial [Methylohalobius sp.]